MAHPRAKLTEFGRRLIVERVLVLGWSPAQAAASTGFRGHRLQMDPPIQNRGAARLVRSIFPAAAASPGAVATAGGPNFGSSTPLEAGTAPTGLPVGLGPLNHLRRPAPAPPKPAACCRSKHRDPDSVCPRAGLRAAPFRHQEVGPAGAG